MTPKRRQEIEALTDVKRVVGDMDYRYVIQLRNGITDLLAYNDSLTAEIAMPKGELEASETMLDDRLSKYQQEADTAWGQVSELKEKNERLRTRLDALVKTGEKVGVDVSRRLRVLADWLDREDKELGYKDNSVQQDLRIFADNIDALAAAVREAKGEK